jgi:hypothetical protein
MVMGLLGLFSGRGLRGTVYTLFGAVLLSALWVTSLTVLSDKPNATALLTQAGTQVLNPFLVEHDLGLSQSGYASLQASAKAAPAQPLKLSVLKVRVLGSEIVGRSYTSTVELVYGRVASTYYTGGPGAVFEVPAELKQTLPDFGLFNPNNAQLIPGGPKVSQLPPFLQPLFVFIGLTPETFTAGGHQNLLGLLPWFWIAAAVLGVLAILLNRSGSMLSGLAQSVVHSTWPIVAILVGVSILVAAKSETFGTYAGVLGIIRGAFLPVYGAALAVGLLSLLALKVLPGLLQRKPATAPVGVPAGGMGAAPSAPSAPPPGAGTPFPGTPGTGTPLSGGFGGQPGAPYPPPSMPPTGSGEPFGSGGPGEGQR